MYCNFPVIQKTIQTFQDVASLREQVDVLQQKVTVLNNLDEESLQQSVVLTSSAVPIDKSLPTILSTMEGISDKTGVTLKSLVIDSPGSLATQSAKPQIQGVKQKIILLDPRGKPYKQSIAKDLTRYDEIVLLCGHYEGIDERIRDLVDETISIGDYVITGGELPAILIVDSISRLLPGVLTEGEATIKESFTENLLEYPQYTRPAEYNGQKVPEILLSGNHAKIDAWQKEEATRVTKLHRPDLIKRPQVSKKNFHLKFSTSLEQ